MVFDEVHYVASDHAIERWCERVVPGFPEYQARQAVEFTARSGVVLLETDGYRYIRNGDLFLPCVEFEPNTYRIKTILTWDMVDGRLQNIIYKYHEAKTV